MRKPLNEGEAQAMNEYCLKFVGHGVILEASNESQPDSWYMVSHRANYNIEESKANIRARQQMVLAEIQ